MKTLDRYIIKQFLVNYMILFVVLMTLFTVVDLLVDLDEFIQAGEVRADRFGGRWLATLASIVGFYGPKIFLLYAFFSGILVAAATGFTMSALTRTRELHAMMTGGISLYRVAMPVVVVGSMLNFLVLPDQELIIPEFATKLARQKSQVRYETIQNYSVVFAPDGRGALFSAAEFVGGEPGSEMMRDVTILISGGEEIGVQRVTAEQAFWLPAGEEREAEGAVVVGPGWELVGGNVIAKSIADSVGVGSERQVQSAVFIKSDLSPTVLLAKRARSFRRLLSIRDLQDLAKNETVRSEPPQVRDLWKIIYSRFSMFVLNVLLQLVGLTFFMRRVPGNQLLEGAKAAGVCLLFWGMSVGLLESGSFGNPAVTAWLPVVVFLPITFAVLTRLKT